MWLFIDSNRRVERIVYDDTGFSKEDKAGSAYVLSLPSTPELKENEYEELYLDEKSMPYYRVFKREPSPELIEQPVLTPSIPIQKIDEIIVQLKKDCSEAVYAGFLSDSTGYMFGFNDIDQANFTQRLVTIVVGYLGPFQWKTIDAGVVTLTKEEFLVVAQEAEKHKLRQQEKFWMLEAKAKAATTDEELNAISW